MFIILFITTSCSSTNYLFKNNNVAVAMLYPASMSTVKGSAHFVEKKDILLVEILTSGLDQKKNYEISIHEKGNCKDPIIKNIGELYDPFKKGSNVSRIGHLIPNSYGTGKLKKIVYALSLTKIENSIIGKSIIVRDVETVVACGLISKDPKEFF